ncbi:hypothetical protein HDU81_000989 [Chytriomyces hyalinus]|nr:hypothetical protein HDU81_000989 [Chytriomyces hyalinus]
MSFRTFTSNKAAVDIDAFDDENMSVSRWSRRRGSTSASLPSASLASSGTSVRSIGRALGVKGFGGVAGGLSSVDSTPVLTDDSSSSSATDGSRPVSFISSTSRNQQRGFTVFTGSPAMSQSQPQSQTSRRFVELHSSSNSDKESDMLDDPLSLLRPSRIALKSQSPTPKHSPQVPHESCPSNDLSKPPTNIPVPHTAEPIPKFSRFGSNSNSTSVSRPNSPFNVVGPPTAISNPLNWDATASNYSNSSRRSSIATFGGSSSPNPIAQELMLEFVSPGLRQFLSSIPGLPDPQMTLPIKLLSQYTLHHPLGEGSTGFVVSGTRNLDRVQVAVKFMFKDRIPMGQGGWKRDYELNCVVPMEVFIMRRLEHENIVQFYDVFEDSVFVYIVMEAVKHISYVQPTPISDHGPSTPPLSPVTYPALVIPLKDPDDPINDETASITSSRSTSQSRPISIPSSTRPHSRCSASNSSSHRDGFTMGPSSPLVPAPPLSPTLTTSMTNPLYAIPHPHEMSSPSFPLLVSLNSKVDLTSLDDVHDGDEGEELMALHVGRGGGGKAGFMVGDSESESDEEDGGYERREEQGVELIERRSRFDGLDESAGGDYPMGEEIRLEPAILDFMAHNNASPSNAPFPDTAFVIASNKDMIPSTLTTPAAPLPHQKYLQPSSNPQQQQQQQLNYPPMRVPKSKIKMVGGSVPREPNQGGAKRRAHSKDLFDYIERKPRMSEGVTRLIFKQIADAIAYLHSRGFVHRDIKDENVIIDDSMKVKVIDFGAARSIPKTRTDYFWDFVGTLTYAPPECIPFSADVPLEPHRGPEQDVWSLGVLLFILLETRPPFPPNSSREARTRRPILTTSRSDALKDLLFGMLDPVIETRFTMEAVIAHPWFLTMPTPRGV